MTFDVFLLFMQQGIASGLVTGSVYALLAMAIVIVFRTTDVANFAEGEVYMASAYLAFFLNVRDRATSLLLDLLLTLIVAVVIGIVVAGVPAMLANAFHLVWSQYERETPSTSIVRPKRSWSSL